MYLADKAVVGTEDHGYNMEITIQNPWNIRAFMQLIGWDHSVSRNRQATVEWFSEPHSDSLGAATYALNISMRCTRDAITHNNGSVLLAGTPYPCGRTIPFSFFVADRFYGWLNRLLIIIGLMLWTGLGVAYLFYCPSLIWLWRLLPIAIGVIYSLSENENDDRRGEAIFIMIYAVAISVLFFHYDPTQLWHWIREREVVKWLFAGAWYEILMKTTGFIGSIVALIKCLLWLYSLAND